MAALRPSPLPNPIAVSMTMGAVTLITMGERNNSLQDNVTVASIAIAARTQHPQAVYCIHQHGGTSLHSARQWQRYIDHHASTSLTLQDNGSVTSITMAAPH